MGNNGLGVEVVKYGLGKLASLATAMLLPITVCVT